MVEIFFSDDPAGALADFVFSVYPAGVVGIVGEDKELEAAFRKRGNPTVGERGEGFPDHVRYLAASGGEREINRVKLLSNGRPYVVRSNFGGRAAVDNIANSGYQTLISSYPKAVFYSKRDRGMRFQAEAFAAALGLWAGAVDTASLGDRSEKGTAVRELCAFFQGVCLSDISTEELVRFNACGAELSERLGASDCFIAADAFTDGDPLIYRFFTYYLSFFIYKQFTKCKISDMLFSTDKVRVRILLDLLGVRNIPLLPDRPLPSASGLKDLLPADSTLRAIGERFRLEAGEGGAELQEVLNGLLMATALSARGGLMSGLASGGFLEGILNGTED